MDVYLVGKITNTHGIIGEVRVTNMSDFERFGPGSSVYVIENGVSQSFVIARARPHKQQLIVKFEGYDNINDVLFLKGKELYASGRREEDLEADDFRYDDLIGKKAVTKDGEEIGIVTALIEVPQGHLLEVMNGAKKTLIPFVKAFIGDVNDEQVIIHPIEGLL